MMIVGNMEEVGLRMLTAIPHFFTLPSPKVPTTPAFRCMRKIISGSVLSLYDNGDEMT
jgi:hypothetical protein